MPTNAEPTALSAGQLAAAIRRRELGPVEVMEAYARRIERLNPRLNAVVTPRLDEACAEAAALERRLAAGEQPGPLAGVPYTAKDVLATAGLRTTSGSLLYQDHIPRSDATAVTRMRAAGAILLGKTNCPEFAMDLQTDNRVFGVTRNPWNLERTPGGSSGGDAAAVAAGCSALGVGTDFGGSVRWPAHCTGLVGLRPSAGRVPGTGHLPAPSTLDPPPPSSAALYGQLHVVGPLARAVDDLELALGVLAGPDGRDPHTVPVPLEDSRRVDPRLLPLIWCDGEGTIPIRPDVLAAVERAAECLTRAGCDLIRARPPGLEQADGLYARLRGLDGMAEWRMLAAGREALLSDNIRGLFATAQEGRVGELLLAARERDALRAQLLAFLAERPVLLLPVAALPATEIGERDFAVEGEPIGYFQLLAPCRAISLFGVPSVVVPCGRSREGLPVGVQVVAGPFQEHLALAVARLLERELGGWQAPSLEEKELSVER